MKRDQAALLSNQEKITAAKKHVMLSLSKHLYRASNPFYLLR
jgi:hypothetical protein